eukprot:COSAG02_NODE_11909_length_1631_cov_9.765013_2_plen_62_part_00
MLGVMVVGVAQRVGVQEIAQSVGMRILKHRLDPPQMIARRARLASTVLVALSPVSVQVTVH